MKKIFALVLALMMALVAVSAFAASSKQEPSGGGSVTPADTSANPTETAEVAATAEVEFIDGTALSEAAVEVFANAAAAGDVLSPLPADVKAKVPAGFGKVNEMLLARIKGDTSGIKTDVEITVMFQTSYENKKVVVLFGLLPAESEDPAAIEWNAFDGEGQKDGSVKVKVPFEFFQKIQNNPFLIGVISE